jgi:chromosome segregation ATPase
MKWIDLSRNQIEFIKEKIFKNNIKLEYINLNRNQIEIINPKLFSSLINLKQLKIHNLVFDKLDERVTGMNGALHQYYENYLKDTVTLTRGKLDQMKNQVEESSNENLKNLEKLKFVRMKYESCIENNVNTESKFEIIQNKLDFVHNKYELCIKEIQEIQSKVESKENEIIFLRNKYELCIEEATEKNTKSESNDSPNIQALKTAEVIKENYDIIRNSYTDVTFDLADYQVLEAHRHILEGELHIFFPCF